MYFDCRMRPPTASYLPSAFGNVEKSARSTANLDFLQAPSVTHKSLDLLLDEMKQAGISRALIPARQAASGAVPNEDVADVVRRHPDLFMGFAALDPADTDKALADLEKFVLHGPLCGVGFEPGMLPAPLRANDPNLFPLYDACQAAGVPVSIMTAAACGPDISFTMPSLMDDVARAFPKLTIISAHGGWPWVTQNIYLAQRHPNVWLCPDFIMFNMPGMQEFWQAANYFLQDRFLFATGYPHVSHKEAVEFYRKNLRPEVMPKVMAENAARLLHLS